MKQLQQYTYTIPANGSVQIPAANDNFIITAATGALAVRGDTFGKFSGITAGQGLKNVPFQRLELFDESGAPNTVTILLSPAEFVNQVFSGSVDLTLASVNALTRPELPAASWNSTATLAANTPLTIIAPGANVNGAIVWTALAQDYAATTLAQSFLAKATAPVSVADGEVIEQSFMSGISTTSFLSACRMAAPQRIAAGLGLYFISSVAGSAGQVRSCRYTLL